MTDTSSLTNNVIITTHNSNFATIVGLHDFIIDQHWMQNY
jgi:hypothetical protein